MGQVAYFLVLGKSVECLSIGQKVLSSYSPYGIPLIISWLPDSLSRYKNINVNYNHSLLITMHHTKIGSFISFLHCRQIPSSLLRTNYPVNFKPRKNTISSGHSQALFYPITPSNDHDVLKPITIPSTSHTFSLKWWNPMVHCTHNSAFLVNISSLCQSSEKKNSVDGRFLSGSPFASLAEVKFGRWDWIAFPGSPADSGALEQSHPCSSSVPAACILCVKTPQVRVNKMLLPVIGEDMNKKRIRGIISLPCPEWPAWQ